MSDSEICNPSRPDRAEIVIPVGALHGLVVVDALNWAVVRRTSSGGWDRIGYHRTAGAALLALAHAEVAAGCAKVGSVNDLHAAFEAALLAVAIEARALDGRVIAAQAECAAQIADLLVQKQEARRRAKGVAS